MPDDDGDADEPDEPIGKEEALVIIGCARVGAAIDGQAGGGCQ